MIPSYTLDALERYSKYHLRPGDFLVALLGGNLDFASHMADRNNAACLKEIVTYIEETLPKEAFGTAEKVAKWIANEPQTGFVDNREYKHIPESDGMSEDDYKYYKKL